MSEDLGGRRARVAVLLGAAALAIGGFAGCGDDGESSAEVEARIAAEREDAAKQARQQERIKELEKDLEEVGEAGSTTTPAAPVVPPSSEYAPRSFASYSSVQGGWQAQVPTGGGWSDGVDTQINDGLFRTTFTGPAGAVLIVDSTPFEKPAFSGDADRTPVSHPLFSGVEKLVFRGNTSVSPCETSVCVDFLMPFDRGGYAVLAGGPGSFPEFEAIAQTTMLSLSPFDI